MRGAVAGGYVGIFGSIVLLLIGPTVLTKVLNMGQGHRMALPHRGSARDNPALVAGAAQEEGPRTPEIASHSSGAGED